DRARLERAALRRAARESGAAFHRARRRVLRSAREADPVRGRARQRALRGRKTTPDVRANAQSARRDADARLPRRRPPAVDRLSRLAVRAAGLLMGETSLQKLKP